MEATKREVVSIEELKVDRDVRIEALRSEIDTLTEKLNTSEQLTTVLEIDNK